MKCRIFEIDGFFFPEILCVETKTTGFLWWKKKETIEVWKRIVKVRKPKSGEYYKFFSPTNPEYVKNLTQINSFESIWTARLFLKSMSEELEKVNKEIKNKADKLNAAFKAEADKIHPIKFEKDGDDNKSS